MLFSEAMLLSCCHSEQCNNYSHIIFILYSQVLAKKVKHHAGSIYCVAWNTLGTVIATGSNDHSVKCVQWLSDQNVFGKLADLYSEASDCGKWSEPQSEN